MLNAAMLTIHAIGQAYAAIAHIEARSGLKQLDRLLSNVSVKLEALFPSWIRFVVGVRTELIVWKTHRKSDLEGHRTQWEHDLVQQLHRAMAPSVAITLLADRGFGDQKLYELLALLGWDYVIRFRGAILVENAAGEVRPASDWVRPGGRAFLIHGAKVTADKASVPGVVLVHARNMKEPWCLATSLSSKTASEIVKLYGRRFTIEETFRDTKDIRFGLGLTRPTSAAPTAVTGFSSCSRSRTRSSRFSEPRAKSRSWTGLSSPPASTRTDLVRGDILETEIIHISAHELLPA